MMKCKIKKNDLVLVLTGRERGKRGKVLRVYPDKGTAIVENVNFVKKHTRANPQKNIKGGIVEREAPIRISNLMGICKECQQPSKYGVKILEEEARGRKVRVCKSCGAVQD